jgi:hypothetical protein
MKKRNLVLLAVVYWMMAIVVVGVAVITAGDCGIAPLSDRVACVHDANLRRTFGFLIALTGFPIVLVWYAKRRRGPM